MPYILTGLILSCIEMVLINQKKKIENIWQKFTLEIYNDG